MTLKTTIALPDKTYNYKINSLPPVYVRTGVIGDGSCFFHAYLRAFHLKYKYMPTKDRREYVQKLRREIADTVDLEKFKTISDGEYRKMLFFGALRQLLDKQYIPILEKVTTFKENFYTSFIQEIFQEMEIADKKAFVAEMKKIFLKANDLALVHFKNTIETEEIGSTEIEYISKHLRCNFLFLYETTDGVEIYPFTKIVDMDWPFCVLLWVQQSHYEIIGKKDENSVITRVFYKDDDIVRLFLSDNAPIIDGTV
jgi:hypothetical protein